MKKKWTLKEAIEKRLLLPGDYVNITKLYSPYRTKYIIEDGGSYRVVSLEDYKEINTLLQETPIYKNEDGFFISIRVLRDSWPFSDKATFDLLGCDTFKVTINGRNFSEPFYKIFLDPNVIVSFEGENETPFLELAPRKAYTC